MKDDKLVPEKYQYRSYRLRLWLRYVVWCYPLPYEVAATWVCQPHRTLRVRNALTWCAVPATDKAVSSLMLLDGWLNSKKNKDIRSEGNVVYRLSGSHDTSLCPIRQTRVWGRDVYPTPTRSIMQTCNGDEKLNRNLFSRLVMTSEAIYNI